MSDERCFEKRGRRDKPEILPIRSSDVVRSYQPSEVKDEPFQRLLFQVRLLDDECDLLQIPLPRIESVNRDNA